MLNAIEREMTAMLSNDRKVLMFRFDIHVKEYTPDNKVISDCLNEVKKFIKMYGAVNSKQSSISTTMFL